MGAPPAGSAGSVEGDECKVLFLYNRSRFIVENPDLARTLEELKVLQQEQVQLQKAMLEAQLEHARLYREQLDRVDKINHRAEKLQDRSANLMGAAGKTFGVILLIIVALIGYLTWVLFRF